VLPLTEKLWNTRPYSQIKRLAATLAAS
jgi:hypothetical protein